MITKKFLVYLDTGAVMTHDLEFASEEAYTAFLVETLNAYLAVGSKPSLIFLDHPDVWYRLDRVIAFGSADATPSVPKRPIGLVRPELPKAEGA